DGVRRWGGAARAGCWRGCRSRRGSTSCTRTPPTATSTPWRRATTAARSWPRSRPGRCGPRSSTTRSRGPRACASSPTSSAGPSSRRPRRDREPRRSPVMDLYPAIDLRDGRCVRLYQGDYARETVYAYDPVAQARAFVAEGASWIHIVDLDAARTGEPRNYELVATVAAAVDVPVQCGGGVR